MRKAEAQGANAVQMTVAVVLGGLLALGVELVILLLGAVAVSKGILRENISPQMTAVACVAGCLIGGALTCAQWGSRRLLAGLATSGVCYLLVLAVGLLMSNGPEMGLQALIELAGCLCGGALAGVFGGKGKKKKHALARKK